MRRIYLRYSVWFILVSAFGVSAYRRTGQWLQLVIPLAALALMFAVILFWTRYNIHVSRVTTDLEKLDRMLRRRRKRPLPGYIYAAVRHDYETAERLALRMRSSSLKVECLVSIALNRGRYDEAKKLLRQVERADFANYTLSIIALHERDWEGFWAAKKKIVDPHTLQVLEAEFAFATGEMEEAERLGERLIETTQGLQRYILEKSLETNRQNPHRETVF